MVWDVIVMARNERIVLTQATVLISRCIEVTLEDQQLKTINICCHMWVLKVRNLEQLT